MPRYSSGMKSVSTNDASWAIFIAPPRSWPMVLTIRSAASACWPRAPLTPAPASARPTCVGRRPGPVVSLLSPSFAMGDADSRRRTVDELLADARARIHRRSPADAAACGAQIIDIRSDDQRRRDGLVPGALCLPRNALEWRVDPDCPHRDPRVAGTDQEVLLLCDEGFQSSLAAATLRELGFARAGDIEGGFQAWRAAGLPVTVGA